MNPPKTANRDPAEYLASVLPLNPIFQAEEILAARNRFLGRKESPTESETWQLQEQRETLHAQINTLRERFWTNPPKELREALEGLAVEPFPDLKLASDRLRAALRVRAEFPKLAQHPKCEQELFEKLKEVAVASPRDAGRTKQAFFLRTSANLKLYRRCVAMIQVLRKEFPEVFDLEADWLRQIEQTKPIAGQTVSEKESAERAGSAVKGFSWAAVFIAISILGRVFTASQRTFNSPPSPSAPAQTFSPDDQAKIQKILQGVQRSQSPPVTPPVNNPSLAPPTTMPSTNDDVRKRLDAIRQDARERLERQRNRTQIPNLPPGIPQPRGP